MRRVKLESVNSDIRCRMFIVSASLVQFNTWLVIELQ